MYSVSVLMTELKRIVESPYKSIEKNAMDCMEMRMLLAEWARLCQYPVPNQRIFRQLAKKVMLFMSLGRKGIQKSLYLLMTY